MTDELKSNIKWYFKGYCDGFREINKAIDEFERWFEEMMYPLLNKAFEEK